MENNKFITNKINADIILKELLGGIRFGTDALLLADFASKSLKTGVCIDLGTGSGVIPLLLLGLGCKSDFVGLELQKEYAEIASENANVNGFSQRFKVINGDAFDYKSLFVSGASDWVVTNPPYMRLDCGFNNKSNPMAIARREVSGGIEIFCQAAAWALKSGGGFFAVYRPDRLAHLLYVMKQNKIEPKRLRAVCASHSTAPSLVLVEGKKDGKEGLIYEPNLYMYSDDEHKSQSEEMEKIYNTFK